MSENVKMCTIHNQILRGGGGKKKDKRKTHPGSCSYAPSNLTPLQLITFFKALTHHISNSAN